MSFHSPYSGPKLSARTKLETGLNDQEGKFGTNIFEEKNRIKMKGQKSDRKALDCDPQH